jgi:tetratricopeptide (TPR) repeat protein
MRVIRTAAAIMAAVILSIPRIPAQDQGSKLIEPELPQEDNSLYLVEGENAVSTNFTSQPTLDYDCSGQRSLQLNNATAPSGNAPYYAEFAFDAGEGGSYELWYGGTPPGPADSVYPSYASPFSYSIGDAPPVHVHREDVHVVGNYAPSYYWVSVGRVEIAKGFTNLRFMVNERRRLDNRYYFYLDCFFLVRLENGVRVPVAAKPAVFPADLADRSIDEPFKSYDDYQIQIRDQPGNVGSILALAKIYTLAGDSLNAIKYLKTALSLDPKNSEARLLSAKNRIWKGDIADGLDEYAKVIEASPDRRELYLEAGKLAAWHGDFGRSFRFYDSGLAAFPNDPDLIVNEGLAYLWNNQEDRAKATFAAALEREKNDPAGLSALADTYMINGYPADAAKVLRRLVALRPALASAYFALATALASSGDRKEADKVVASIDGIFKSSDALTAYVDEQRRRSAIRDEALSRFEAELAKAPDNLALRQTLAQSYFWNGRKAEAIGEYSSILANYAYLRFASLDRETLPLHRLLDFEAVDRLDAQALLARLKDSKVALQAAEDRLKKAKADLEAANRKKTGTAAPSASEAQGSASKDFEAEVSKATEELNAVASIAESVIARAADLGDSSAAERKGLPAMIEADKAEAASYAALWKDGWTWDRRGFVAEEDEVARSGLFLADFVLLRLYQIENDRTMGDRYFARLAKREEGSPEIEAAVVRGYIAKGDAEAARKRLEANAGSTPALPYAAEMDLRLSSIGRTKEDATTPDSTVALIDLTPAADQTATADQTVRVRDIEAGLADTDSSLRKLFASIDADRASARALLSAKMVRNIYRLETDTYLIRNQLADYYVAAKEFDPAVYQLSMVLKIDPANIQARYSLGTIYQRRGDWREAGEAFKTVYAADPGFDSVLSLYNRLAEDHAPAFGTQFSYLADYLRTKWRGEADFQHELSDSITFKADYAAEFTRMVQGSPYLSADYDHLYYESHDVSAGLALKPFPTSGTQSFTVTPAVGDQIFGNGLIVNDNTKSYSDALIPKAATIGDYFPVLRADLPYVRVDSALKAFDYFRLNGQYRYGVYQDSFYPGLDPLYAQTLEMNAAFDPGIIGIPVLDRTAFRLYGKGDLIASGDLIYTGLGEVTAYLIKGGSPYTLLYLIGDFTAQDDLRPGLGSSSSEATAYWKPNAVTVAEGGLGYATWLGMKGGGVFGISLQAKAGRYEEASWTSPVPYLKLEGIGNLELTVRNLTATLGFDLVGTRKTYEPWGTWTYWSSFTRLGVSIKLPDYLVP